MDISLRMSTVSKRNDRMSKLSKLSKVSNASGQENEMGDNPYATLTVEETKPESKAWLWWSLLSCVSFTICNFTLAMLSTDTGAEGVFYYSSGCVLAGIVY